MLRKSLNVLVAGLLGLSLGACTELTGYFVTGDPADVSSCAYVMADENLGYILGLYPGDSPGDEEGALCVECNSDDAVTDKASYCGNELSVRCNSDLGNPIYGLALAAGSLGSAMVATAWEDADDNGADDGDLLLCHEQSGEGLGKQEWKCTNALKGNGKDATTFEAGIKYDESKNNCN